MVVSTSKSLIQEHSYKSVFPPKRILAPIDGSENATRALHAAIELSKKYDSELFIIMVTPRRAVGLGLGSDFPGHASAVKEYYENMDKRSEYILANSIDEAKREGLEKVNSEAIPEFESVARQILEQVASKNIDLIVIGTRGLGGFKKLLVGSVSSEVLAHATCNVLVVR